MKRTFSLFVIFLAAAGVARAQKGTAVNGYYPQGYGGATWSGAVSSVNKDTREITLEYKKGDKVQTFVGVPTKDYSVKEHNGPERPLRMEDIPVGRVVKVWYMEKTTKVDGKKVSVNEIFEIDAVANATKGRLDFMAF